MATQTFDPKTDAAIDRWVAETLANWPPLTEEQVHRAARIFARPTPVPAPRPAHEAA